MKNALRAALLCLALVALGQTALAPADSVRLIAEENPLPLPPIPQPPPPTVA